MMPFRKHAIISACLLLLLGKVTAGTSPLGKGIGNPYVKNVHIITIGVNYLPQSTPKYYCAYCENDASRFASRMRFEHLISQAGKISDSRTQVFVYELTGKRATLAGLQSAFDSVELLAAPEDAVLFYYSGISVPVNDGNGGVLNEFLLYGADAESEEINGERLSLQSLKFWLNKVRARYQLIVTDAGRSAYYMPDFFKNLSIQNSFSLESSNRKRIFIYPATYGFDFYAQKSGMLSYVLSSMDSSFSLLDFFTENLYDKDFELQIRLREDEVKKLPGAGQLFTGYVTIFKEWEFAKQYGFLVRPDECAPGADTRGGVARPVKMQLEKQGSGRKDTVQRNIAILIATDEYDHLNPLQNPVNDAKTLGKLLSSSYGFDTYYVLNASNEEFGNTLKGLFDTMAFKPNDQLLVFVAGHGIYDEKFNIGFIAHRNSKAAEEDYFKQSYTQFHSLVQYLENSSCEHIMLLVDVCYGGSIRDAAIMRENECTAKSEINWAQLYAELDDVAFIRRSMECPVRRYITSGTKYYAVPDGRPGEHSPFARKLLETLGKQPVGAIQSGHDLYGSIQRLTPQPSYGRFGKDVSSADFLFIRTKL